jgi:multimeric flavodoxin WrbA
MKPLKRVLILTASPRKNGNSTILALKAAEGVKAEGGEADVVPIGNLRIAPCNACDSCRTKPEAGCVIKDDMQPLYQKIKDAQGIIFATPVYWFNVSAQMKLFIDRSYAIHGKGYYAFTGKDVGVILTYEDEDVFVSGGSMHCALSRIYVLMSKPISWERSMVARIRRGMFKQTENYYKKPMI